MEYHKILKKSQGFFQPLQKPDGKWTKTHQKKADEFRRHLSEVFQQHKDIISDTDIEEERAKITPSPPEEIGRLTPSEISDMIKYKVKVKKAPGMDAVTGEMLKNLPNKVKLLMQYSPFNSFHQLRRSRRSYLSIRKANPHTWHHHTGPFLSCQY